MKGITPQERLEKWNAAICAQKASGLTIKEWCELIILASFEHRSCNTRTGFLYYSNDIPVTLERCS